MSDDREKQRGLRHFASFMHYVSLTPADGGPLEQARRAWPTMVAELKWSPSYTVRARSSLMRVLQEKEPDLARGLVVNNMRHGKRKILTESSHETSFRIHDCLPRTVRILPSDGVQYKLLCFVVEQLVEHLKSACRMSMQKKMLFVQKILFQEPPLIPSDCAHMSSAIAELRQLRAQEWLQRLSVVFPGEGQLGCKLFRSHVNILNILHTKIFKGTESISIPVSVAVTVLPPDSDGTLSGYSSFAVSDEDGGAHDGWKLQQEVKCIRARVCKRRRVGEECKVTSFTPDEVDRIINAARTTEERLVVSLLMSTGVRLGGLCRIRSSVRADWASDLPSTCLSTVEKGNVHRMLHLNACTRVLLARWFREDRPAPGRFLFPSPREPSNCISTSYMWRLLRTMFKRANISGSHAHPHTFRHTFIHMMSALGVKTEVIAKFVGHRSASTTAGTYSRMSTEEMEALAEACPIIGDSRREEHLKERWRQVLKHLQRPYEFSEREMCDLVFK